MDISAMKRPSRSQRARSLPGANECGIDEYDLEMGRSRVRNRARSRRRQRRRRERAGPDEDNSSAMLMMLCACCGVVVFLLGGGIFIAYQRDVFSSGTRGYNQQQQQPQQQVHYVTKPNQGNASTHPNPGSEGTTTPETTVTNQVTSVVGSSKEEQEEELRRRHRIVMSDSTKTYSQVKEHLNWIRLQSYWAMSFNNNRSFWRSTNNTGWFGSDGGRGQALQESDATVVQKAQELMQSVTSPDRINVISELCRNKGIHPLIRDILAKANRKWGDKTWTNKFSESRKEAYVDFYCYCHHVDKVFRTLSSDYRVFWYDVEGYVWRYQTDLLVGANDNRVLGADPTPPEVEHRPNTWTHQGSFVQYLQRCEQAAYSQGVDLFAFTRKDKSRAIACGAAGILAFVTFCCMGWPCWSLLPIGIVTSGGLFWTYGGRNTLNRLLKRAGLQ